MSGAAYGSPEYTPDLERAAERVARSGSRAPARLAALARLATRWPDDAVAVGWLMRHAGALGVGLGWADARRLLRTARARGKVAAE